MKESLLAGVFWDAGLFLTLAALIIPALRFLKIPTALGYLLAGIALGPYGLSVLAGHLPVSEFIGLQDATHIKILAELGIVLLLFIIGLELTPQRLWQMRHLVFGLGSAQVLLSACVIGIIAFLWGNSLNVSILLGLGLGLSSTALIIQWLQEQKLFASNVGRTSFSILLFQDLAVIPILLLLTILSLDIGSNITQFVSLSLVKMIISILVIYFIGKILLKPIFVFANRHGGAEVFMALSLLTIVLSASVANVAGLSMALGAFIAGLLLADTEYRHEIESLVVPFKSMLIGIFFVSFGMGINLNFVAEKPLWLFASVIGLMSIKAIIIFSLCKLWKQSTSVSAESAILLSQAGEFGLLVVGGSLAAGLMDENIGQFMLIVIGVTMFMTPILTPIARKIGIYIENSSHDEKNYHANQSQKKEGHIVIFGFGRVGQAIANTVCKEGFKYIGFDKDINLVSVARSDLRSVYLGDALKNNTLKAANIEKSLCVVVTIDNANATQKIVRAISDICSTTPIVVRAHTADDAKVYDGFENVEAIAENILISKKLSNKVFKHSGYYEHSDN
ncbi:MAG: cation:proton antiporter [Alphaproteobacteria bacterium]